LKHASQFVRLAFLLAMLVPTLPAQQSRVSGVSGSWDQEVTGSLATVKNLRLKIDMGSVVVRGGKEDGIHYVIHSHSFANSEQEARRQFEAYKVNAYVRGDTAWIMGDLQGARPRKFSGEVTIRVPREMALVKVETQGGSIDATGVAGKLEAQSGGGSIHVDDIAGGVSAETGGGSIEVGTIGGEIGLRTGGGSIEVRQANGRVVAETGGGSVEIHSASEGASIETGGGSIEMKQCKGKAKVSTGGGSIDLGDISGPVDIETGGGSIHLTSAKGHVHAQTGGGGIELYGVPSAYAQTGAGGIVVKLVNTGSARHDSELETSAGDITVYIAPDVAINLRASVDLGNGHRITSDFPEFRITSDADKWGYTLGPRTLNAEGKLNGGGPLLKVHTTTGDICIRRSK
jgi:DUF4097 and DUF4098 domain-containing protein YvlB